MYGEDTGTFPVAITLSWTPLKEEMEHTDKSNNFPAAQGLPWSPGGVLQLFSLHTLSHSMWNKLFASQQEWISVKDGYFPTLSDFIEEKFPLLWLDLATRQFSPGCKGDCSALSCNDRPGFPQTLTVTSQTLRRSK